MNARMIRWLVPFTVCHLILAAALPRSMGDFFGIVGFGICAGQVNLLALWTATAQGKKRYRIPIAAALAVLFSVAIWLSDRTRFGYTEFIPWFAVWVLIALVPLGAVANLAHWRLAPPGDETSEAPDRQFRLWHILFAMTLLAGVLGFARFMLFADGQWLVPGSGVWRLLTAIVAVGLNALATAVPCLYAAFWTKDGRPAGLWISLAGLVIYACVIALAETLLLPLGLPFFEQWLELGFLNLAQVLVMFSGLVFLRWIGFRLRRSQGPT